MIATRAEVKEFLQIPALTTTYDTLIDSLIPVTQEWLFDYCNNWFEVGTDTLYLTSITISFSDSDPDTILDSDNNFVNAGFVDGMHIRIKGSLYNNGVYEVDTVVAGTITLVSTETLTTEDQAQNVTITVVNFPQGLKLGFKAIVGEELKADFTAGEKVLSENVGNTTFSYGGSKVKGSYPKELLSLLSPYKRPVKV